MINIFTNKNLINYSSEQLILFGLQDDYSNIKIEKYHYNDKNESRYNNVIETCKEKINYVDNINESDIVVLPYKFRGVHDKNFINLFEQSKIHRKTLYIFYNDDNDKQIIPKDNNIILYRTSFYKSTKLPNEYAMPAFDVDNYKDIIKSPSLSIGYCGHSIHNREKYINILKASDITTDFIIRQGFWAPEIKDKTIAKKEYLNNINNNLFTFCYRGAGNFSYRFYDVMMMGRIPILINTDCVFPFEDKYDINEVGVVIDEKELEYKNIIQIIKEYYEKNKGRLEIIQKNNRIIWEKYYSCIGFIDSFCKEVKDKLSNMKNSCNIIQHGVDGFGHQLYGLLSVIVLHNINNYIFNSEVFLKKPFKFGHVSNDENEELKRYIIESVSLFSKNNKSYENSNIKGIVHTHEIYKIPKNYDTDVIYSIDNAYYFDRINLNEHDTIKHGENIKNFTKYFKENKYLPDNRFTSKTIVIHIRLGDAMNYEEWRQKIDENNKKIIELCTIFKDKYPNHKIYVHSNGDPKFLEDYEYTFCDKDTKVLRFLSDVIHSDIFVCSPSGLSLVGTFLTNANTIIIPDNTKHSVPSNVIKISDYLHNN